MEFHDLPEDIIRLILGLSDIYVVVSMSRTNRYLRRLAIDKLVWVDLVNNLWCRGFLDRRRLTRADIRSCSQEELVDLVKRLMIGPRGWNFRDTGKAKANAAPPSSTRFPGIFGYPNREQPRRVEPTETVTLHPSEVGVTQRNEAKLLDGGEHILICNRTLECRSVQRDTLVWSYEKKSPHWHIIEFAAEVVDGGDSVNIIICEMSAGGAGEDQSVLQIINLKFETGMATSLLVAPYATRSSYGFRAANICGPIACACFKEFQDSGPSPRSYCVLLNWKTQSHFKLVPDDLKSPVLVNIIPDHILVLTNNEASAPELVLVDITSAAFTHNWRRMAEHPVVDAAPVLVSQLQPVVYESVDDDMFAQGATTRLLAPWKHALCAYPSPLEEGTYRVWVRASGFKRSFEPRRAVQCSYRLSIPAQKGFTSGDEYMLRWRTAAEADPECDGITYSGHGLQPAGLNDLRIFPPGTLEAAVSVKGGSNAHLSGYGGVLTFSSNKLVHVSYFE